MTERKFVNLIHHDQNGTWGISVPSNAVVEVSANGMNVAFSSVGFHRPGAPGSFGWHSLHDGNMLYVEKFAGLFVECEIVNQDTMTDVVEKTTRYYTQNVVYDEAYEEAYRKSIEWLN